MITVPFCEVCGEQFTREQWENRESEVHTGADGGDVHAECCPRCREAPG